MSIKIIKPGLFTTVQDLGRIGYRSLGIGPGGAMDSFAASVANLLVGNKENTALLEMHFPAAEILFEKDLLVSATGGDFTASLDGVPIATWQPILVRTGQVLAFKKYTAGARAYLAIQGGLKADQWLNSSSTHTKVKAGGYLGRALLKDDRIAINDIASPNRLMQYPSISELIKPLYEPENIIRCTTGPEWQLLSDTSKNIFYLSVFSITAQSDRMGYRLTGTALQLVSPIELVSSPVCAGTLQLLPSGQLILLMADHQTTGGYPRVANVISADLPKLAQAAINQQLNFILVDIENAEEALFSMQEVLASIKRITDKYYAH